MGNKLCAPLLKRSYRNESYPWHTRKDSHLLRLWADVFQVHGNGEYMRWQRVSDDVVPINITCIEDTPSTVFHITAYNRHVEKIFDVKISQPGTIICPATECFVHWRDPVSGCEWGLNFQTPTDACRFKDCCSFPTQRFARKASSANSLQLSPPKRVRSKAASASSPSSPSHQRQGQGQIDPSAAGPCDHLDVAVVRVQQQQSPRRDSPNMTSFKPDDAEDHSGYRYSAMVKPASNSSVYDNCMAVSGLRNPAAADGETMVFRKSMPQCPSSLTSSPARSITDRPNSAMSALTMDSTGSPRLSSFASNSQDKPAVGNGVVIDKPPDYSQCDNIDCQTLQTRPVSSMSQTTVTSSPGLPEGHVSRGSRLTVDISTSRHTSSSESPEWPSPPEPLTPQTPLTPLYTNTMFDSEAIQRMLRSLPASPVDKEDLGFHDDPSCDGTNHNGNCRSGSLSRTKSLNTHDRCPRISQSSRHKPLAATEETGMSTVKMAELPKSRQLTKVLVEQELLRKNQCAQSSYPDSGIGGMMGETSGSLQSGDSGTAQLKSGPRTNHDLRTRSSGGSSGGSNHSDIINQLGEGSEVKHFLSAEQSDADDTETDGCLDTMTESESQLSYVRQVGAIRKAGWLVVKNWLVHKKRKIELAARRNWRRYWVCLKGTTLLFFDCDEETVITQSSVPRHILVIEGGIAQAVPEHPKRDNILSLSTACGDAYLLQASCQNDLENWIRAIHSACASSYARQHGKDNTLKLLKSELEKLEANIDTDVKMRKMAELQMTIVSDPKSRQAIVRQIAQWEENLEKLYVDQYRFRCYIASLLGTELSNPKVLLANASKLTKTTLGRLGIFTVTSFHALVCARKPLVLPNIYGKGSHKGGMLSPRAEGSQKPRSRTPTALMDATLNTDSVFKTGHERLSDSMDNITDMSNDSSHGHESLSRVILPNQQTMLVGIDKRTTVQHLLETTCNKRQLNPRDHYVRIKPLGSMDDKFVVPERHQLVKQLRYEALEVCQKSIFQLELTKLTKTGVFGFAVEAELAEDLDRDDELRVYVCEITPGSVAEKRGLLVGDEILVINGKVISELDMVYIETLLHESRTLFLTIRSFRTKPPVSDFITDHANTYIDNMVCPPPPSQPRITEKVIGDLIVPAPASPVAEGSEKKGSPKLARQGISTDQIDALLKGAEQVTAICRNSNGSIQSQPPGSGCVVRTLSDAQRLRKVIMELIETERAYVKDLNCLMERYLVPLQDETFLTSDEIHQLFGNIQEIVPFQRQFLTSLEEAIELESDFFTTTDPKQFRRVLFSIGGSFLYYANHFKVYSSFCASHSRSQKVLNIDSNDELKNFLRARNPKQQHSATLESFLIKPIQRILKYPLLLHQLCQLAQPDTDEHHHLTEALRGMEAVAEHINEMQKIYEEYGSVFDDLSKTFKKVHPHKQPVDLSVGELQMYGMVEWCNMLEYLGKVKKTVDFENTVFVFRTGVVFLCRERSKRRKTRSVPNKSSSDTSDTVERFRTLIPTQEVQVHVGKISDIDRHYWWDLVHSRSDTDSRPERLYQFCNSTPEAKADFMKVIRQTIRESVRRMTIPANRPQQPDVTGSPQTSTDLDQIPNTNKKRPNRPMDPERHSMDFDEKYSVIGYDNSFRTRSKTIGDLNEVSLDEGMATYNEGTATYNTVSEPQISQSQSPDSSNSNLSGSSHSGSARLLYASANPLNYSSSSVNSPAGSPIWKQRPGIMQGSPKSAVLKEGKTGIMVGEQTGSPKRKDTQKTVVFASPPGLSGYKDTEC